MTIDPYLVATNGGHPAVARAARQQRSVADFLYWSRYPFATIRRDIEGVDVVIGEARTCRGWNPPLKPTETSFFLGRQTLIASERPGMAEAGRLDAAQL